MYATYQELETAYIRAYILRHSELDHEELYQINKLIQLEPSAQKLMELFQRKIFLELNVGWYEMAHNSVRLFRERWQSTIQVDTYEYAIVFHSMEYSDAEVERYRKALLERHADIDEEYLSRELRLIRAIKDFEPGC